MKNEWTELVFILDRSGSMHGLEEDVVGGFNRLLAEHKTQPGQAFVTTVLFNQHSKTVHDRVPISDIAPMTAADYTPQGMTALLDALGDAVRHIADIHKYARPEDVPAHTIFVVTTDGLENTSRTYSHAQVRDMVSRQQKEFGWEFLFLGANIDAVDAANSIGICNEDRIGSFAPSTQGAKRLFRMVGAATCELRAGKTLGSSWKKAPEE